MKQDTEQSFLHLLETYKAIVYKISNAYTATVEDRKDLFQDIVAGLWKSYPNFKGHAKLSTWVYRVALYTAITNYRRGKKQVKYEQFLPGVHDGFIGDLEDEPEQNIKRLYMAIKKLSAIDKAIILLLLEENSYADISQVLGLNSAATGMRIKRAKDRLADLFKTIKH
jgi:RNA polymerase sigma-70 factor (ECF subfamily)